MTKVTCKCGGTLWEIRIVRGRGIYHCAECDLRFMSGNTTSIPTTYMKTEKAGHRVPVKI